MSKRVLIGLFALSVVAFAWTEAHAGCAVIAGFQICASWITGGSEVAQVTAQGFFQGTQACNVFPSQGSGSGSGSGAPAFSSTAAVPAGTAGPVSLKLAGTKPRTAGEQCGIDPPFDQCDIRGVAFCGASSPPIDLALPLTALTTDIITFGWPDHVDEDDDTIHPRARRAKTPGPLKVVSPQGLGQVDFPSGRNFAGFRFQINATEQINLCPGREFITFIAREGFFEARANIASSPAPNDVCVRERCTVDLNGIGPDVPRVYRCQSLPPGPGCLQ